ncbi:MAG: glycosyltransferase family 4 protein [bacterium]
MHIALINQKANPADHAEMLELGKHLLAERKEVSLYSEGLEIPSGPSRKIWRAVWNYKPSVALIHALSTDVDIIHNLGNPGLIKPYLVRIFKAQSRLVVTLDTSDLPRPVGRLQTWWQRFKLRRLLRASAQVLANSYDTQTQFKDQFGIDLSCVHRGVENRSTRSASFLESQNLAHREYLLAFVTQGPKSGAHYLVQAFSGLIAPFKLIVVNLDPPGEYWENLKQLSGRDERIIFLERPPGEDLRELESHAYLVVHAGSDQGLPHLALQTMARGVGALISDLPEYRALNLEGVIWINSGDLEGLREKIFELLNDRTAAWGLSRLARTSAGEKFHWGAAADELTKIYDQALNSL